jgi:bacteriorhodopsin
MASDSGWKYVLVHVIHRKNVPPVLVFRQIHFARFVQWSVNSFLILIALTILAGLPGAELLILTFADISMILFVFPDSE